jgi:VPS62-like protein/insecticidal crystal toxin P42 protein
LCNAPKRRLATKRFIQVIVIGLLTVTTGCSLFNAPLPLGIAYRTVSVEVGETVVIPVEVPTSGGQTDTLTVSCPQGCVDTIVGDDTVSITGTELGERSLTIESSSGSSDTLTVRVYDPKALMTGGLALTYVDQFEWRWNDSGSGYGQDGEFYHPLPPAGYYALGSIGQNFYGDPSGERAAIVVKAVDGSDALAAPTGYTRIWEDSGSDANSDGSFWLPEAPSGYRALGVVAMPGHDDAPSLDDVRCVREDLVVEAKADGDIWVYTSLGIIEIFGSWQVEPPDTPNSPGKAYLDAGTFVALAGVGSSTPPVLNPALYMLNLELPVVTDLKDTGFAPVLESYDEPPAYTDTYLGRAVAVPFVLVNDGDLDLHWRVTNSPVYRLQREDSYELMYFYDNHSGSTPITHIVTSTVGISQTDSESYSHTVGMSISSTSGCSVIGGTVTVELSYEFGYETTSSYTAFEEQSVSQEVIIARRTAGCLWQKATRFALLRNHNGWTEVAGGDVRMGVDSFVKGEHP